MRILKKSNLAAALLLCSSTMALAASDGIGPFTTGVADANFAAGSPANVISDDFTATLVVTGTDPIENPSGKITQFGNLSDGSTTQPDQNAYVHVEKSLKGPAANYNYGQNYLYQSHENGGDLAFVSRINLDVTDPAHRITLLTPVGGDNLTHFNSLDGMAYNPFTKSVLATEETNASTGGLIEISTSWPSTVTTHYGSIGRCGMEGVHVDNKGRIYMVEDSSGSSASNDQNDINGPKVARQPYSFVYRFVPYNAGNLNAGGQLQALQVIVDGAPLVFGGTSAQQVFDDVWSPKQVELHSGASFPTHWVTIHDTATSTDNFDCNLAARTASATPFKRPENGAFKPNGNYKVFDFVTTGDTNNLSGSVPGLAQRGAWGGIWQLTMGKDQADGKLKLLVLGDADHNSFDNITFGDSKTIVTTEDRGDSLHDQLNTLDSIWAYPMDALTAPYRLVALGRDASASGNGAEDNEPTGVFVSNGGSWVANQYGKPNNLSNARGFFTQQHGDNKIYELTHN